MATKAPVATNAALPRFSERRRHWRFLATYRVEYQGSTGVCTAYMANMSQGGMLLRGPGDLFAGQEQVFSLHIDPGGAPLLVSGLVLEIRDGSRYSGARVQFIASHQENQRLNSFVVEQVVPRLEVSAEEGCTSAATAIDLCALYRELGRTEKAYALYQRALQVHGHKVELCENAAEFLLDQARAGGDVHALPYLREAEDIVRAGLEIRGSRRLREAMADLQAQKQALDLQRTHAAASQLECQLRFAAWEGQQQLLALRTQLLERTRECAEHREALQQLEQSRHQQLLEIEQLQRERDEQTELAAKLRAEQREQAKRIAILEEQSNARAAELAALLPQSAARQQQIDKLRGHLANAEHALAGLKKERDSLDAERAVLKEQYAGLRKEIDAEWEALERDKEALAHERLELQAQRATVRDRAARSTRK